MKGSLILAIVAMLFVNPLVSQANSNTHKDFYFVIGESGWAEMNAFETKLPYGARDGLRSGDFATLYGVFEVMRGQATDSIGRAQVVFMGDTAVKVKVVDAPQSYPDGHPILLKLRLAVDQPDRHTVFLDLAANSINFLDVEENMLVDQPAMLRKDNRLLAAAWMKKMQKDIRYTAEEFKEELEKYPIKTGPYEGMMLYEVMRDCEIEQIHTFLKYMRQHPRKYRGLDWKISEIFATWITQGALVPSGELRTEFLAATTEAEFGELVRKLEYPQMLTLLDRWTTEAEELGKEAATRDEGIRLANACLQGALIMEHIPSIGEAWFALGNIYDKAEQPDKALAAYANASEEFIRVDTLSYIFCENNHGKTLVDLERYKKGNTVLADAIALLQADPELAEHAAIQNAYGLLLRNYGNSFKGMKKYKKAMKVYAEAADRLSRTENSEAKIRLYVTYCRMEETAQAMGKKELAEEYATKKSAALMDGIRLIKTDE